MNRAAYVVEVTDLRDLIQAERTTTNRRFWRQFVSSAGATLLAGMFTLLDRSGPAVVLTLGFLALTLMLLRWHVQSRRRISALEEVLAQRLEEGLEGGPEPAAPDEESVLLEES